MIAVSLFSTAFVQVLAQDLTTPTFYFSATGQNPHSRCPTVQTFQDGNVYGPCGNRYGPQSKYWAAIRDGGAHCGESIVMTYGTNSITLTVQDSCPGCSGDNHVDMGIEALVELTGSPEAACAIDRAPVQVQWRFGSGGNNRHSESVVEPERQLAEVAVHGKANTDKSRIAAPEANFAQAVQAPELQQIFTTTSPTTATSTSTSTELAQATAVLIPLPASIEAPYPEVKKSGVGPIRRGKLGRRRGN